ncbi:MAG: GIY-YIG nuclease family protein [Leptolyngbyaceae cyanobacterium RM2_2_4]|nr:GIY-YIG nuclease family protein [Leptolyngbyaceae cyanobacterium RM2_2_4]
MIIYKITNLINSKSYVGQTICSLENRWAQHNSKSSRCRAISNALRKYGKEKFTIEILVICNSLKELNEQESIFIKKFNTLAPNGYNLTSGGEGKTFSEESRSKISNAKKGKAYSEQFKKMRSESQTGKNHSDDTKKKMSDSAVGKLKTDSHRANISKSKTGISLSAEHRESIRMTLQKPIKCDQTAQVFDSASAAAKELKIGKSTIIKILKKRRPSFKGLSFSYC